VAIVTKHFKRQLDAFACGEHAALAGITYPKRLYSALRKEIQKDPTNAMERFVARHFYSQVVKSVIDEGEAVQVILDCGYKDKSTSAGRIWS
jgi:hypothetical protein